MHTALVYKFFVEHYNQTLISGGFTHNALSLNIDDIKEVFDLIKNKYEYANETLYSKTRNLFNLQSQTMFNTYSLNIKKRKVNIIRRKFIDLNELRKYKNLDIDLFVINKSGENKYKNVEYLYEKYILNLKYNESTKYEIPFDGNITEELESAKLIEKINETETNSTNKTNIFIRKHNISLSENKEILKNNFAKENYENQFLIIILSLILLIILISIIILFKDIFSDNSKGNLRNDNDEKYILKERGNKIIKRKKKLFLLFRK